MLYNVQFLRFIAALLVVVYHCAAGLPENDSVFQGLFDVGESFGFAGVDIFFVISGFIMAHTTMQQSGRADGVDFGRRRLARIYSGYWPFFILTILVFSYFRAEHYAGSNLFKSFFLWPQPLNLVLLEVTWTLSFELYFYLLFSLLILTFKPRMRLGVIAMGTLFLLVLNLYRHFVADSFSPENIYYMSFWSQFLSSPFLLEFFSGSLLAWWLARKPGGLAMPLFLSGCILFFMGGWINVSWYSGLIEQGYHVVPRVFFYGVPACMILAGLVRMEANGQQAPRRFSTITGGASYAIYLSHTLILTVVWNTGFNQLIAGWPGHIVIIAYVLLVLSILGISVLHFMNVEKPLHKLFKQWIGVKPASR